MCPICMSTALLMAASAASGGSAFVALKKRSSAIQSQIVPKSGIDNLKEKGNEYACKNPLKSGV